MDRAPAPSPHGFDHVLEGGDVLSVHAPEAGEGCLPRVIVWAQGRNMEDLPGALQWTFEPDAFTIWACDSLHRSDPALQELKRTVDRAPLDWQSYPEVAADIMATRALRTSWSSAANAAAGLAHAHAAAASEGCADDEVAGASSTDTPAKRGAELMPPSSASAAKRPSVALQ